MNHKNKIDMVFQYEWDKKDELFPYWVTGFAEAESYFVIKISKRDRKAMWHIIPLFGIELHIKDKPLLVKIQSFFKIGYIKIRKREGITTGIYSVQSLKDIYNVIIPHFSKYPILTQKRADFELLVWLLTWWRKMNI